jgi:DNA-binding MarR family transcriptional regulator
MDGDKDKGVMSAAGSHTPPDTSKRPDPSNWQQSELLSYKLAILSRLFERGSEAQLARHYGLWLTDCRLLGHLLAKSPRTVRDLAEDMVMDKAPISRSASRLVEKGMLTREADPADGRSAMFNLTVEGRKLASTIMSSAQYGQGRYLNLLPPEDCWVLVDAIDKLLDFAKTKMSKTIDPEAER